MNTLSYGLLAMLSANPFSGYEISQKIQPIWRASHSQIYPLLANMEKQGYISHRLIEQSDKPDKKEYSITEAGLEQLRGWVELPADSPAVRDELNFKLYSLYLSRPEEAKALLKIRAEFSRSELKRYNNLLAANETLRSERGEARELEATTFGRYLLIRKRIGEMEASIQFCEWALQQIESS